MKNVRKKGFSLVELVIVIAVIAILAGVMIGTFAGVMSNARKSKAVQELKAAIDEAYITYLADENVVPTKLYKDGNVFTFKEPASPEKTYTLYVNATTKTFVELDSQYHIYLLWEAGNGYSVKSLTSTDGYTAAVVTP
jgi:prepilin-type N-terminal cleavage/methylation domain-containing protein